MWGPEIKRKELESSLWGSKFSQQVQGDRITKIARYSSRAVSNVSVLGEIARNADRACIELEAFAEELMRQRDAARTEAFKEARVICMLIGHAYSKSSGESYQVARQCALKIRERQETSG